MSDCSVGCRYDFSVLIVVIQMMLFTFRNLRRNDLMGNVGYLCHVFSIAGKLNQQPTANQPTTHNQTPIMKTIGPTLVFYSPLLWVLVDGSPSRRHMPAFLEHFASMASMASMASIRRPAWRAACQGLDASAESSPGVEGESASIISGLARWM